MTQAAIETFALTKRFPVDLGWRGLFSPRQWGPPAVDRVDLVVYQGELFGLVGPNGAGKTTLIKLLTTLILPNSGSARVGGYDLSQDQEIRRIVSLGAGDERSLYWRLTGRQNLEFFATLYNLPPELARQRIDQALRQVGLQDAADQRFQTYSTGMRQRLTIARALLTQPQILFLDEPTRSLDPTATRKLHALIREHLVGELGITVFFTTHRLEEAEKLCDRIAIMDKGRILACGTMDELRAALDLKERYHLRVRGFGPQMSAEIARHVSGLNVTSTEGDEATLEFDAPADDRALIAALNAVRTSGGATQAVSRLPASLDEIFAQLTESPAVPPAEPLPPPQISRPALRDLLRWPRLASPRQGAHRWRTTLRIAWAFILRDLRTEMSYRLSFFFQLFGIFSSVFMFYFVAQLLGAAALPHLAAYGGDYFSFVLIGIAFSSYFGLGLSSFSSGLRQAQSTGTLEALLASPVGLSTLILCSSLWSYVMTTVRVLIYLAVGVLLLGVDLGGGNYPAALLILILTIICLGSLGIIAASFIMVLKRGDPVTWLFGSLSGLLSGVYYPIEILPAWLQPLSRLIPVTYSLQAMRRALLQGATFAELSPDLLILFLFTIVVVPLGLLSFRYAVRYAKIEGSLSHY